MKKFKIYISILLCFSMFITGCSFQRDLNAAYNTDEQLSIGISDKMSTIKTNSMGNKFAVIPFDSYVYSDSNADYMASLLINISNNSVLQCSNPHKKIYPASMTKIMTAMIIADEIQAGRLSLDENITLSHTIIFDDPDAVSSGLIAGDTITVNELLHGLLIRSFNDCCIILAERIAGSESAFCDLMNAKAKALGATNTHFSNSHGLHLEDHYTTVYDLYIMFHEFTNYELLTNIDNVSTYMMKYTHADGTPVEIECAATNGFLGEYELPDGLALGGWKTGTTTEAGNCLILEVNDEEDNQYIAIIAKAVDKNTLYEDMTDILGTINE